MRSPVIAGVIWITCLVLGAGAGGCSPEPIGQPCAFNWPVTEAPGSGDLVTDCATFPTCAPLQDTGRPLGDEPRNDNCPVDCIQIPSLECTNLICVATQVESDAEVDGQNVGREQLMNGQCATDVVRTECLGQDEAKFGCIGYCTKECLSDASCPKGYRCARMAPFGENLRCDDETLWGDGGGDDALKCTADCTPTGGDPDPNDGQSVSCPSSVEGEASYDYGVCELKKYRTCCACLCYRFCPLLTKKFCRKIDWDREQFPGGLIPVETKICAEQE